MVSHKPTSPSRRDRLRKALRPIRHAVLKSPLLYWPLAAIWLVLLVLLLNTGSPFGEHIPDIGEVAPRDYRTRFDVTYEYPDPASEARARAASERTPRIYRFDPGKGDERRTALRETFADLRARCHERDRERSRIERDHKEELAALELKRADAADRDERAALAEKFEAVRERHAEERRQVIQQVDDGFALARSDAIARLGSEFNPASLDTLAEDCFPQELEDRGQELLTSIFQSDIIEQRQEILPVIELGISVARPGSPTLEHIDSLDSILELAEARRRIANEAHALLSRPRPSAEKLDPALEAAFIDILQGLVRPNLSFDHRATKAARARIREEQTERKTATIPRNRLIVRRGETVTPSIHRDLLGMKSGQAQASAFLSLTATTLLLSLLVGLTYVIGVHHVRMLRHKRRDLVFLATVLLAMVGMLRLSLVVTDAIIDRWPMIPLSGALFGLPFAAGGMFVRIFVGARASVVFSTLLAILTGLLVGTLETETIDSGRFTFYLVSLALFSGLIGSSRSESIQQRFDILQAGLVVSAFNVLFILGINLLEPVPLNKDFLFHLAGGAWAGLGASLIVSAFAPAFEWLFGYVTDIKLLELGNQRNKLLQDLILNAPGTNHHSFLVASMVEQAAPDIRANPLLARVAALYHDVGKTKNPEFFAENQRGKNCHDRLPPSMSALILRAHVRDSLEMADEAGLARDIRDIIEQHHGTTLIQFFYDKACKAAGDGPAPPEADYRYPGPKPQSREAALVMLADSVEAAVRSLPDKDAHRIRATAKRIILEKFTDGQLEECDLTLRNLTQLEKAFTKLLAGVHHARPTYPDRDTPSGRMTRRTTTSTTQRIDSTAAEDKATAEPGDTATPEPTA